VSIENSKVQGIKTSRELRPFHYRALSEKRSPSSDQCSRPSAAPPFATDVAFGNSVQIDRTSLSDPITLLDLDGPVIDTR
jgi:hypothetical protein